MKFFICEHCKNLITFVESKGVPVMCCGQKMTELIPGAVEAAVEKHIPVVKVEGNVVEVTVAEVTHPMMEEHHIAWIALETNKGSQIKYLDKIGEPKGTFLLSEGEEVVAVYEYCNLHGLWKSE